MKTFDITITAQIDRDLTEAERSELQSRLRVAVQQVLELSTGVEVYIELEG